QDRSDRGGNAVLGQPVAHLDAAALVADAADGMGQHDGRIGRQAAPMAGMDASGAEFQDEVELEDAACASGDGGDLRHDTGTVAGDQDVSFQAIGVDGNKFAKADGASFLAGFKDEFQVEPQLVVAFFQDGFQGRDVQNV